MKDKALFERLNEIKESFKGYIVHRKKTKALDNYSLTGNFKHHRYLMLIKNCLNDGFLDKKESDFIDYMIAKYQLNFLDWSHRTKWLKKQINQISMKNLRPDPQLFFIDLDKKKPVYHVPLELLGEKNSLPVRRI